MIDTSLDSFNFYFFLAIFQGVIISALTLVPKSKKIQDIYLGILFLLFSLAILHTILESSIHVFNVKFPVPLNFRFAFGPLAYLHVLSIKDPYHRPQRRDLLHFVPMLLFDILLFSIAFTYLGSNIEWAYDHIGLIQSIALYVAFIHMIQLGYYSYLIYRESIDTRQVLRGHETVKKWLSILVASWVVTISFHLVAIPIGLIFIEQLDENQEWIYVPLNTIKSLWIFLLGYLYLTKYRTVLGSYTERIKLFKFKLHELEAKKKELLQKLEREELYKDSKLTIAKLAGHLGWPINSASKMINDTLQTSFNDLVNRSRVDAFKELSKKPESKKYSILGLGEEVGFSSKASFYRVFKKETGMTPSEFMKAEA